MPYIFAQKRLPGGWVRYRIEEHDSGAMRFHAIGGDYTATLHAAPLPGVPVVYRCGGDEVRDYEAVRVSGGVAYPMCLDWIRDRM